MKVIVLQDWLRSGGTERQAILLTRGFRAAGHEARLVAFRPGGKLWDEARDLGPEALQRRDWGWDWLAPGLRARVRAEAPDIVLAMGRMANCHLSLIAGALPPGGRAVATFRTGKKLPWMFRRSLRRAHGIVANSQDAADTLVRDYGLPREKVAVIYNALVFRETEPIPSAPATTGTAPAAGQTAALSGSAQTPRTVCLNVAMFRPEKNQAGLIRLFAALPDTFELWLAGDGPAKPACEHLVQELGLQARVRFLGFTPDPSPLYAAADVAVHASTSEALSNFLIEAQAHGLPAVACAAQGNAECFIPGRTGWVVPQADPTVFQAAVRHAASLSPEARAALAAEARAFAREHFTPERQTKAYLSLFSRLLASPAPPQTK